MSEFDYGPQWLRSHGKKLSPEGERVARFCEWLFDGIYHEQTAVLNADWSTFYVSLNMSTGLATWDFNMLTRLVVGAHDMCIRVDIEPCNCQYFRLVFHPRDGREGSSPRRHPTMEQALEKMSRPPAFEATESAA